jgi:hypothetical protein
MAKDGNTFAKRQRETLKRLKAEDKRRRRQERKDQPSPSFHAAPTEGGADDPLEPPTAGEQL